MAISNAELIAVQKVLSRGISRETAARKYDNRLRLLVAVAILQGAGVRDEELVEGQGIYGDLMYELVVQPAAPADGWPTDKDGLQKWPGWLEGVSASRFVTASGTSGFHRPQPRSSGAHGVKFVGSDQFDALLDKATRAQCREWFNQARRTLIARNEKQKAAKKAHDVARAKFENGLERIFQEHSVTVSSPRSTNPAHVQALIDDLQKLLKDTKL